MTGSSVAVVVGAGGKGSEGECSSFASCSGAENPGHYTGGDGAPGQVTVAWTCP
jgi:hypothetical protein